MGIDQFLTDVEKIETLNRLKSVLSVEIYSMCVKLGIDPDNFEYVSYSATNAPASQMTQFTLLESHCQKLSTVVQKLESIENA
jgi:hypothetical protein